MSFNLKNTEKNELLLHNQGHIIDDQPPGLSENHSDTIYDFGNLTLNEWLFDGILIRESKILFNEPLQMDWQGNFEMVTMHFNLKGALDVNIKADNSTFSFKNNQHNLMYGSEAGGAIKVEDLVQHIFMIQMGRDAFFRIAENGNEILKRFADDVYKGKTAVLSNQNLNIDLSIQRCIQDILTCNKFGALKKMYLFSKTIELLVLQAEAYNNSYVLPKGVLKTEYERDSIIYAKEFMLKHIDFPPTLTELSRIVGINEFKLKKGFKEVFGTTVFGYLAETRLEMAKNDLLDSSKTVSQIALELGYSSVQHFSNAFKKRFNISPGQIKNQDVISN
ncbi:AraC family transcriptional regulator [Mucilaginibacter sp.]|uniref:helix-turn-helix transcriptional regulator n=1 Tax=Mucilaginibacter sp. TaxID=1882438 RepID=UPI002ED5487B